ncbi:MAG: hypothetical protein RL557_450 [archaeon]
MNLLREGESGVPSQDGFQVHIESVPEDTTHYQKIQGALDDFLNLTEITPCYQNLVKTGFNRMYGPHGLESTFIMSMLLGILEMKDKKREQLQIPEMPSLQDIRKLLVGGKISEREAHTLGKTGRLNFDLENLTLEVFDPDTAESVERQTYERCGSKQPFSDEWKNQINKKYRS